jgi:thioredoxin reductase
MNRQAEVIVIGAGPAGICCAMQLKRHGIEPLVIEKGEPGGLLHNASLIENLPGYPLGITSEELISKLELQLEVSQIDTIPEEVTNVTYDKGYFQVSTPSSRIHSGILVIASGTDPVIPDPMFKNIPYIYFDVRAVKKETGKEIAIVGAGDASFDYAIHLAGKGNEISIFNRGTRVLALPLLRERADRTNTINYFENYRLTGVTNLQKDNRLSLSFNVENSTVIHNFDYLIFATGRIPAVSFLDQSVVRRSDELAAERKLFYIGDVKGGRYRQAAIAAGEGIKTAMIISYEGNQENSTK